MPRPKSIQRVFNEVSEEASVSIDAVDVEQKFIRMTQDDVELSFALRIFQEFPDEVIDAVWTLFQAPSKALIMALAQFMKKRIVRRIMESGAKPQADLDLVESGEVLTFDQPALDIPQKIASVLHDMRDTQYDKKIVPYNIRQPGSKDFVQGAIEISNQTWLTQGTVESIMLSMVHTDAASRLGYERSVVASLFKEADQLPPLVFDFMVENFDGAWDSLYLSRVTFRHADTALSDLIEVILQGTSPIQRSVQSNGCLARTYATGELQMFLDSASADAPSFYPVLFAYLYPSVTKKMYDAYMQTSCTYMYCEYGMPALELWLSHAAVNYTTQTFSADYLAFHSDVDKDLDLLSSPIPDLPDYVRRTFVSKVEAMKPKLETGTRTSDGVIAVGYVLDTLSAMSSTDEDYATEFDRYFTRTPMAQRNALLQVASRNRKLAGLAEYLRCLRVSVPDKDADAVTNKMADLFPDQFRAFYNSQIVESLLPDPRGSYKIVSNSNYLSSCVKAKYPKADLTFSTGGVSTYVIQQLTSESADILLLDLSVAVFNPANDPMQSCFSKTWSSPLKVDNQLLVRALTMLKEEMDKEERLTALVRIPLILHPIPLKLWTDIAINPGYKLRFNLPHSMHELYMDVVIYPIENRPPIMVMMQHILRMDFQYCYYADGVLKRHALWEKALQGSILSWKSERFKHLSQKDFALQLDIKKQRVVTEVVTRTIVKRNPEAALLKKKKKKAAFDEMNNSAASRLKIVQATELAKKLEIREDLVQSAYEDRTCGKCLKDMPKHVKALQTVNHGGKIYHADCYKLVQSSPSFQRNQ